MAVHARIVIALAAAILIFSAGGFYTTYFRHFPGFEQVSGIVHFHLITLVVWLVMLAGQAILAYKGLFTWHRVIGKISYVWAPLIVISFIWVTDFGQQRLKSPDLLGAALFDGTMFVLFYILGILNRKKPDIHSGYMMLTAIPLINPSLGRLISPEVSITTEFLLLIALWVQAFRRKKSTRPFSMAIAAFIILLAMILLTSVIYPTVMDQLWQKIWGQ